jgi:hypothetical protein
MAWCSVKVQGQLYLYLYCMMLAECKTLDTENNSLTIDLSEEEWFDH